jgi:hypothetical protein
MGFRLSVSLQYTGPSKTPRQILEEQLNTLTLRPWLTATRRQDFVTIASPSHTISLTNQEVETLARWVRNAAYLHSRPLIAPPSDELNFVE